jgi:dolichyl-phosphate-mannose--protein O-mannosyl transferase
MRRTVPAFIVLGYLVAWLMWMPGNEQRVLFFYHMLGALLFASLALGYWLSKMRGRQLRFKGFAWPFPASAISYGVIALAVASFVFFYPYWTGMPLSSASHDIRIWLESWA